MLPFMYERKKKEDKKEIFEYLYIQDFVPEKLPEKKEQNSKEERGVVVIQL